MCDRIKPRHIFLPEEILFLKFQFILKLSYICGVEKVFIHLTHEIMESLIGLFFGFLMIVAICMLFVGPVQLIWAAIHPLVSKNKELRKHYGYYWIGVLFYFAVLTPIYYLSDQPYFHSTILAFFGICFFFSGGIGLAIYHIRIIATNGNFKQNQDAPNELEDIDFAV